MELIDREVEVLQSLRHPHIIHLEEVLETPKVRFEGRGEVKSDSGTLMCGSLQERRGEMHWMRASSFDRHTAMQ